MDKEFRSKFRMDPYGKGDEPEGSDYKIFVGPQHPWAEEACRFIIHLKGEVVSEADIRIGFSFRGVEKAMENRTWVQNIMLVPRSCGICGAVHQNVYVQIIEALAGVTESISDRARYIRMLSLEAERIHSHMLWYGILAHDAGFDTLFQISWRDREIIMDIMEDIGGNRVNYSLSLPGGVRRDIDAKKMKKSLEKLDELEKQVLYHKRVFVEEASLRDRIAGLGRLSKRDAELLNCAGPNARGSGVPYDVRKAYPYELYDKIDWKPIYYTGGEPYDVALTRLDEVLESINIMRQCFDALETEHGETLIKVSSRLPEGRYMSRAEAPRGEDIHFGISNGTDTLDRYKIRAPSLANIDSTLKRLDGEYIADVPVILRTYDPCFSCTNRVLLIKEDTNEKMLLTQDEFARKATMAKKYNRRFF